MESVKFEELGLYPQLLRAIKEMGFEEATPIQAQAIPVVMSGVDVIGQAQTGTGKTASFGIPLLMKVDPNNKKTQAIVLSPTRELAIQSAEEIRKLAKYMHGIKVLPVYGGQDIGRQIKALKGGATIIIGTPGRIMADTNILAIRSVLIILRSEKRQFRKVSSSKPISVAFSANHSVRSIFLVGAIAMCKYPLHKGA